MNLLAAALARLRWRGCAASRAADCPRNGTLGTSRILARRCRRHPAGRPEKLSADAAAGGSRGRADLRRRPVAADDAAGAGGAGPGMRARDVLPDRQAGVRTSGPGAKDRGRGPHASAITPGRTAASMRIKPARRREEIDRGIAADRDGASRGRDHHSRARRSFVFPALRSRRRPSICCNRAASRCSAPISGPATGIR